MGSVVGGGSIIRVVVVGREGEGLWWFDGRGKERQLWMMREAE